MNGRFVLKTSLTIRNPADPKVKEIISEIRDRFGDYVVRQVANLVVIRYNGNLDITSVARLNNLVGRLGDHAAYGALVDTSFGGVPNALRVIGPTTEEIATTRHIHSSKIMSFEKERMRRMTQVSTAQA
jgi:hypothetical protein